MFKELVRTVAVERGYGFLKATDGAHKLVVPSLVKQGKALPGMTESMLLRYQDREYLVGATAQRQADYGSRGSLADEVPVGEESRLLYLTALAHLSGRSGAHRYNVVAGLPVDIWDTYNGPLREMLNGIQEVAVRLDTGGRTLETILSVESSLVLPQPLGVAFDLIFAENGVDEQWVEFPFEIDGQRRWPASTVAGWTFLVIDVGFNTVCLYALADFEPISRFCLSPKLGMAYAYQRVARSLGGGRLTEWEVSDLIRSGSIPQEIWEPAYRELAGEVSRIIGDFGYPFKFFVVGGGGGAALWPYLLPDEANKVLVQDPQMAIARGLLKAGRQKWQSVSGV